MEVRKLIKEVMEGRSQIEVIKAGILVGSEGVIQLREEMKETDEKWGKELK